MIKRKIIFVNGPPHSGKDTVCDMLLAYAELRGYGVNQEKLAAPLRSMAFGMVPGYDDSSYDDFKQREHSPFFVNGRQLMIDISERFMKPVYGKNIFGQMMLARMEQTSPLLVHLVSDSGFQHEVDFFYGMGHDIVIANVHRPGCDFAKDSRQWVRSPNPNRESFQIDNSGSLDHLRSETRKLWLYAANEFRI